MHVYRLKKLIQVPTVPIESPWALCVCICRCQLLMSPQMLSMSTHRCSACHAHEMVPTIYSLDR